MSPRISDKESDVSVSENKPSPRGGGPRTATGKNRSRRNALKYAFFAKALLLPNESENEYRSLVRDMCVNLGLVGALEQALGEKLVASLLLYRRFIAALTGEIRKNTEFLEPDEDDRVKKEADEILEREDSHSPAPRPHRRVRVGLMRYISNPRIREVCIELLRGLGKTIVTKGLHPVDDIFVIEKLYGRVDDLHRNPRATYDVISAIAESLPKEPEPGMPSLDACLVQILEAIKAEIERLVTYDDSRKQVAEARIGVDRQRASLPCSPEFDRLWEYGEKIDKAFDRTLRQLRRLQRMRLRGTVVPAIKLDLDR